jgi:hypothetical protein
MSLPALSETVAQNGFHLLDEEFDILDADSAYNDPTAHSSLLPELSWEDQLDSGLEVTF